MIPIVLESALTCPHCAQVRIETMPLDACVHFYACTNCGVLLKPKPGDCCVFCSYGNVQCPPKQIDAASCGGASGACGSST